MKIILGYIVKSIAFVLSLAIAVCLLCMPLNVLIKDIRLEKENVGAYSETLVYAKAKSNCHLFKTSDITDCSYRNVIFIVPNTYFVSVLQEVNSYIYRVQYLNKIGYVSADSVVKVDFIPIKSSLENIQFDISEVVGTQMRSSPTAEDSNNVLAIIPAGSVGLNYIADVEGEVPTGGTSKCWYYALYSPESDPTSVYEGYVYSEKTKNLTEITLNGENQELGNELVDGNKEERPIVLNEALKIALIVLICIPIVLVFVLLVIANRKNKEVMLDESVESKCDSDKNTLKSKFKKVDELRGVSLTKKQSVYDKFITTSTEGKADQSVPSFPTYEIVDDDDLL